MKIPNISKFSKASQLSVLAIVILLSAIFFTINSALETQTGSSHASGATTYQYGNSYCQYIGLTIHCYVPTPILPTPTVEIHHAPTPTPTPKIVAPTCAPPPPCLRNGVLICLLPRGGWCGVTPTLMPIQPTATPTKAPTAAPIIPTATPTVAVAPTNIPSPKISPVAGDTILSLTLGLHGIGTAGDSTSPNSDGNMHPLHPNRTVTVTILNAQNQQVANQQGTITYSNTTGHFDGTIDLGGQFSSGPYTVKVQTSQYLRGLIPGIQTITNGTTNRLLYVALIAGDINGDNQINILDYNILMGCYSDLLPAVSCTSANNALSDLNDDSNVNQFDYNIFLRELSNVGGN